MIPLNKYKLPEPTYAPVQYMTTPQLVAEKGNEFLFDVECYPNFFLIGFKSFVTGRVLFIEQSEWETANLDLLRWITGNITLVGFNSKKYDLPMLWACFAGLNYGQLHALSNKLILGGYPVWRCEKEFKFTQFRCDHIDLQQVAPAAAQFLSLKQYGGRMHVPKLQDLPIDPHHDLTIEESRIIRLYNVNDLDITGWLRYTLDTAIKLRETMGKMYGVDLRSLSDAQIAEKTIASELKANAAVEAFVPKVHSGTTFKYRNPPYQRFFSDKLKALHQSILDTTFVVDEQGKVRVIENGEWRTATNLWSIKIGQSKYKLGIGGLHSSEQGQTYFSDDKYLLLDRDVASYYPAIILNQGLFPTHLGPAFLNTYRDIVNRRLEAKKAKDKPTANSLKIVINGSFGKLGSRWSVFYAPDLLVQVTLTGQLSLLMLIEMLEWSGIPVVSANTDGIVCRVPTGGQEAYLRCVRDWEAMTGFETEETRYASIHSRDVNNYFAIADDGEIKAKGAYTNDLSFKDKNRESLMTNPNGTIVTEAVMLFLKTCKTSNPITIEQTISKCKNITKFLFVKRVNGGAVKDGVYIGKVVRWYMRKGEFGCIRYSQANAAGRITTVSETTGSHPLMDLTDFPKDVDVNWYIRRAHSILKDVGYYSNAHQLELAFD
jgi:hypothetical protein